MGGLKDRDGVSSAINKVDYLDTVPLRVIGAAPNWSGKYLEASLLPVPADTNALVPTAGLNNTASEGEVVIVDGIQSHPYRSEARRQTGERVLETRWFERRPT